MFFLAVGVRGVWRGGTAAPVRGARRGHPAQRPRLLSRGPRRPGPQAHRPVHSGLTLPARGLSGPRPRRPRGALTHRRDATAADRTLPRGLAIPTPGAGGGRNRLQAAGGTIRGTSRHGRRDGPGGSGWAPPAGMCLLRVLGP